MLMVEIYKCPKCKVEAEIDIKNKTKKITHSLNLNRPRMTFPSHSDCELVKPVSKMDFSKLEKRVVV